jgi:hypothetical protein
MRSATERHRPRSVDLRHLPAPCAQEQGTQFCEILWPSKLSRKRAGATSAEQVQSLSSTSRRRPSRGRLQPMLRCLDGARSPRCLCERPAAASHLLFDWPLAAAGGSHHPAALGHGCDATMAPGAAFECGGGSPGSMLPLRRQFRCAAAPRPPFSTPNPP